MNSYIRNASITSEPFEVVGFNVSLEKPGRSNVKPVYDTRIFVV